MAGASDKCRAGVGRARAVAGRPPRHLPGHGRRGQHTRGHHPDCADPRALERLPACSCAARSRSGEKENPMTRLLVSLVLAAVLVAQTSHATLVELDLDAPGDGLITFDDTTGLLWLDVGHTGNLSYNDVVNGVGNTWYADGWRHANLSEMCTFLATYIVGGLCPNAGIPVPFDEGAADGLLPFMTPNNDGATALNGTFDDSHPSLAGTIGQAAVLYAPTNYYIVEFASDDSRTPFMGNWLVRPIPEPSSGTLLALGLLALGAARRRTT